MYTLFQKAITLQLTVKSTATRIDKQFDIRIRNAIKANMASLN